MTSDEFVASLSRLKLTSRKLGEILGKSQSAVSQWRTGRQPVPGYASAYLEQAEELQQLRELLDMMVEQEQGEAAQ